MTSALLTQVAARAGVSLATASRVLNPHSTHPVGEATRARVLAAAEELNYSSNALARGLVMRRSNTVAVLVHDIRDPYFSESARAIADAANAAGYLTMICNSYRDPATELRYVELIQSQRVAGVHFVGGGFENREYRRALRRHIDAIRGYGGQVVALGPRAERIPGEVPDNRGGARLATEHLLELGHERIAFIDGPRGLRTSAERRTGYLEALQAAGIAEDPRLICEGDYREQGGAAAARELIERRTPFTAIFASTDLMATGALQVLAADGLRVPEDVSLVGFDDVTFARWLSPRLTTVRVPMDEIGTRAMQRLLRLLDGEDDSPRLVNVHPTDLVVRDSTAPPATRGRRARPPLQATSSPR
jgi:LacI family transcriptional regulator